MKNRAVFLFRQYWNRAGKPLKAELRWMRHILLGRLIDHRTQTYADVAVIIPCHNYAATLPRAIESVLTQTMRPREILVVDDASDDDTAAVVDLYAHKGVSYLRADHRDLSETRNSGAAATTGRFLLYLDADDRLPPDYIEQCLIPMSEPKVGLVYGDIQYGNEEHTFIDNPPFDPTFLGRFNFICSNALIRRQAFDLAGGYRTIPHSFEDWDFNRRVIAQGYIAAKASTYVWYDVHKDSMTQAHYQSSHASYLNQAALLHHPLIVFTIFTEPFSDIDSYLERIEAGGFDPKLVHLVWYNASDNAEFDAALRSKIASSPFGSLQYIHAPEAPRTKEAQKLLHIRAWHRALRPDIADSVLSLSPSYPLPTNGLRTMLSHLGGDICAVFAPCEACGNADHDGSDYAKNPCFCCAIVRRGSMDAVIPWETDATSDAHDSFSFTAYKYLRRQTHVIHRRDMWEKEGNTEEPIQLPLL